MAAYSNSHKSKIVLLVVATLILALLGASVSHASEAKKKTQLLESAEGLRKVDLRTKSVIFIGETDHYEPELLNVELQILETIAKVNPAAKKCLLLEAEPAFDEAFKLLSKSTTPESIVRANVLLDEQGQMGTSIKWIGETYQLPLFQFAQTHGWTVRSGDQPRSEETRRILREENPSLEWELFHQVYERNQFMAARIQELLRSDCDLVVGLYGATHLTQINDLPTFKVQNYPVPTLLERRGLSSTTVLATTPKTFGRYEEHLSERTNSHTGPRTFRKPEAILVLSQTSGN